MRELIGYAVFVAVLLAGSFLISTSDTNNAIACEKAGLTWTAPHWYEFTGECK